METATSADEFWNRAVSDGWAVADTDVLDDEELLELASGLGPVVLSRRGDANQLVTTVPVAQNSDGTVFHTEDAPGGERVAWVVLHCVEPDSETGGGTGLAAADAIVDRLDPPERARAEATAGTYRIANEMRGWRLVTRYRQGWSVDLPGARRAYGPPTAAIAEVLVDPGGDLGLVNRVEALAADVMFPVAWTAGRILVFDNRRFLHARLPGAGTRRTIRRVLAGLPPR